MEELGIEIVEPVTIRSWCKSKKWPILVVISVLFIWPVYLIIMNRTALELMANNETIFI